MTLRNLRFSSETRHLTRRKIGLMHSITAPLKYSLTAISLVLAGAVFAADAPLDFSYRVTGAAELRPLMVFNDGSDTFIQPQDPTSKNLLVNGAPPVRQGPYFVVRGVGSEISLTQGQKTSVRIAHTRPMIAKVQAASPAATPAQESGVRPAIGPREQGGKSTASAVEERHATAAGTPSAACKPRQVRRDSAFVATFKSGTSTLSDVAKSEVAKFLGDTSSVTSVEVVAEGGSTALAAKRADSLKVVLVKAGIPSSRIEQSVRDASGIGSEIHLHRVTEVPCGISLVKIPSRKANATVIWDRDGKELVERIASELKVKLTVRGNERALPVNISVVDMSFPEAMVRVGAALDTGADLILRSNELILSFKEKQ